MTEHIKPNWRIDRERGIPGYPFALVAPVNDGLTGEAVLGAFAYGPHADLAAAAPRLLAALGNLYVIYERTAPNPHASAAFRAAADEFRALAHVMLDE